MVVIDDLFKQDTEINNREIFPAANDDRDLIAGVKTSPNLPIQFTKKRTKEKDFDFDVSRLLLSYGRF